MLLQEKEALKAPDSQVGTIPLNTLFFKKGEKKGSQEKEAAKQARESKPVNSSPLLISTSSPCLTFYLVIHP